MKTEQEVDEMYCEYEKKWNELCLCPADDDAPVLSQEQIKELTKINHTLDVLGWVLGCVDKEIIM